MVGGWPEDDAPDAGPAGTTDAQHPGGAARTASGPGGRKGRPSVPSWDDIVFGTKGSGPA